MTNNDNNNIRIGWFSKKMLKRFGVFVYTIPEGGEVIVTCVDSQGSVPLENFDDLKKVGVVKNYVRKIPPPSLIGCNTILEDHNCKFKNSYNMLTQYHSKIENFPQLEDKYNIEMEANYDKKNVCVVCLENKKSHAFNPCGHMCVCETCADKIIQSDCKCPICRADIINSLEIFI